jgi:cobalt/nickel transport system permease protein
MSENDHQDGHGPEVDDLGASGRGPGLHQHPHAHEGEAPHVHPHHHRPADGALEHDAPAPAIAHDHGHGLSFERYTWVCSPIHELDPRAKIVATLAIVLAVVLSGPPRPLELAGVAALLSGIVLVARVPLRFVLVRSLLVIPFAGTIALFAPLQATGGSLSVGGLAGAYEGTGWIAAYAIIAKAWLATFAVIVLSATTPVPRLFKGLAALKVPDVILMLLTFMYRYVSAMRDQLRSLRDALDSRGFGLSRWRKVRLLGNLAGNLFIRAYDRGERVHAAMLSRGWDGTLPTTGTLALDGRDAMAVATVGVAVLALLLY